MADDFTSSLEESMSNEVRAVRALEFIGESLAQWVKLEQDKFDKLYPVKVPRDAIVTNVPSEEDKLRESLGESDEPLDEWIGLREQEVIKKTK